MRDVSKECRYTYLEKKKKNITRFFLVYTNVTQEHRKYTKKPLREAQDVALRVPHIYVFLFLPFVTLFHLFCRLSIQHLIQMCLFVVCK